MKKILWIVAAIEDIGGGERLLFEGLDYFQESNVDVKVVTWRLNQKAFFDGTYSFDNIELLESQKKTSRNNIFSHASNRAKSFIRLYKIAKSYNPDLILCQSEFDTIFAGVLAKLLSKPYSVLIFGQTYQFPWDWVKYTLLWKKHLRTIVDSCQGYKSTIPLEPPKIKLRNRLMIEFLALVRYYFVRKANNTYTLSSQVQWECECIYGIKPKILRAGFSEKKLTERAEIFGNRVKNGPIINFVMLSRLVKKKRVDLAIKAFKDIKLPKEWHLTILGGGEELSNLNRLVLGLQLEDRVSLTGRVSDADLQRHLSSSDVFINMDVGDFEITVIEAMSFGLYVVVSSDFVIDSDFREYSAIHAVHPEKIALRGFLEDELCDRLIQNKPKFSALKNFTWQYYFSSIIKDLK